jgi:hypothetical protein
MFKAGDKKHTGLARGITDARFAANRRCYLDAEYLGSEIAPDTVSNRNP